MRQTSVIILLAAALAIIPCALTAQNDPGAPSSRIHVGKVEGDVQYSKLTPSLWHFAGKITLTSDEYDLAAEDIKVFFLPKKSGKSGAASLEKATADGDPAANKQVDVHIRRPLESEAFEIFSDHAVYVPDNTRPGGGQMDFTGHVQIITHSGFLAEPSISQLDHATVLLGQGDDYPQLETGPAHITLTPAQ